MSAPTAHEPQALPSTRYAHAVLAVMVLMYTCNYLDRFVLTIMIRDIKADLGISDTMVGFLIGPAFAFFYTACGVPIARWADVGSRRSIIALGMTVWSGFTAASGMVTSAAQLAVATHRRGRRRGGRRRARPLAAWTTSPNRRRRRSPSSRAVSTRQHARPRDRRAARRARRLAKDLPDRRAARPADRARRALLRARAVRGQFDRPDVTATTGARGTGDPEATPGAPATRMEGGTGLVDVARHLGRKPTFWLVAIGAGIASFAGTGYGMWMPTFLERVHDLPRSEIGVRFGLIQYIPAFLGSILNGRIADWAGARDMRWYAGVGAIAVALTIPFMTLQLLWPDGRQAIYWSIPSALCGAGWAPIAYGLAQNLAPPHMRAVASSFIIVFITFLGTGLGPWAVGFVNDRLTPEYGDLAIRWSMLGVLWTCWLGVLLFALAARTIRRDMEIPSGY
ncbi:MAG: MFS transporter [Myxococcota bacterium]